MRVSGHSLIVCALIVPALIVRTLVVHGTRRPPRSCTWCSTSSTAATSSSSCTARSAAGGGMFVCRPCVVTPGPPRLRDAPLACVARPLACVPSATRRPRAAPGDHLQGTFDEALARLYTAEIVLAIAHLHSLGFVHRCTACCRCCCCYRCCSCRACADGLRCRPLRPCIHPHVGMISPSHTQRIAGI